MTLRIKLCAGIAVKLACTVLLVMAVGWKPCICTSAREAAAEGRGMGHLMISCGSCHDELRTTTYYEPPHDITYRRAGL